MGTYYHLSCRQCRQYLHFGKKLHKDNKDKLQGMYSEQTNTWINDERIWDAFIGKYLSGFRKLDHVIVLKAGFETQL